VRATNERTPSDNPASASASSSSAAAAAAAT